MKREHRAELCPTEDGGLFGNLFEHTVLHHIPSMYKAFKIIHYYNTDRQYQQRAPRHNFNRCKCKLSNITSSNIVLVPRHKIKFYKNKRDNNGKIKSYKTNNNLNNTSSSVQRRLA